METGLPGSDVASAIDCVVIHGRDKSIVKLVQTLFCYNLFFITSFTQPNGASDAGMKTGRELKTSDFSNDPHNMKCKKGKEKNLS